MELSSPVASLVPSLVLNAVVTFGACCLCSRRSRLEECPFCAIRALLRHRESLVQMAATHVNHMQKALDQMNLQLHHVISDITGQTGLAIVDAILTGGITN